MKKPFNKYSEAERNHFNRHKPKKADRRKARSNRLNKKVRIGRLRNMQGSSFERDVVKAYNTFFRERKIKGFAYRLKQFQYTEQLIDIVVDSPYQEFYQAVECKSIKINKGKGQINFGAYFSDGQIENEHRFLDLTGRRGVMAFELRHEAQKDVPSGPKGGYKKAWREAYLVPFEVVWDLYLSGAKAITIDTIRSYPAFQRKNGLYKL